MNRLSLKILLIIIIAFCVGVFTAPLFTFNNIEKKSNIVQTSLQNEYFTCPMHSHVHQLHEGECPICGMSLIKKKEEILTSSAYPDVFIESQMINNLSIKTTKVIKGPISKNIKIYGYINHLRNIKPTYLKAPISGKIKSISIVDTESKLLKNDVIFTLESDEILQLQNHYLLAVQSNDIEQSRLLKNKLQKLHYTLPQLSQLVKSKLPSSTYIFRSPRAGLLTELSIKPQQYIKSGEVIALISPLYSISAYADVFETQWIWLKPGQKVSMSIRSLPSLNWEGEVRTVADLAESSTTSVQLLADFKTNLKGDLRLGMQTEMNVHTQTKSNVLKVPFSSVIQTGSRSVVVVSKGNGLFQPVNVEVGLNNDEYIEIISGLDAGMSVVTSGQFLIDSESALKTGLKRMDSIVEEEQN